MDRKWYVSLLGALAVALCATSSFAGIDLYEDVNTGQVFTTPGEDRRVIDPEQVLPGATEDGVAKKVMKKLPSWVQKMKLKGDLRLRYDFQDTEGKEVRHRGRYKAQINLDFPVTEKFSTHFQLASGGNDPKSANQTFGNSFEAPDLRLRQAYAQYDVTDWLYMRGGQIENVLWRPSDAVWDKDINPTGVGVAMDYKNESMAEPFMNAALYVIDEAQPNSKDPYLFVLQPGVKLKLSDSVEVKVAGTYYGYGDVKGSKLDSAPGSNTTSGGLLVYDYDGAVASAQVDVKTPVEMLPYVGVFGEYAYNFDPETRNTAYIAGVKLGHKKVKKGDWQVSYSWRRMGKDAVLDILPDSDFFEGKTNVSGHEVIFSYGLLENVDFALDYYRSRELTSKVDEHRAQVDFTFKF
ncbi:MAG TPA: putative porin [Nitrospirota bacterium]